jgi:transposase
LGVGRGYKGKGVLLHLLVDHHGLPLAITSTPANGDERRQVLPLLKQSKVQKHTEDLCKRPMMILEADKGYDASWLRQELLNRNIFPFIPKRRIGRPGLGGPNTREIAKAFSITSTRWTVERSFAWLKRKFRRLLLRWERRPA